MSMWLMYSIISVLINFQERDGQISDGPGEDWSGMSGAVSLVSYTIHSWTEEKQGLVTMRTLKLFSDHVGSHPIRLRIQTFCTMSSLNSGSACTSIAMQSLQFNNVMCHAIIEFCTNNWLYARSQDPPPFSVEERGTGSRNWVQQWLESCINVGEVAWLM